MVCAREKRDCWVNGTPNMDILHFFILAYLSPWSLPPSPAPALFSLALLPFLFGIFYSGPSLSSMLICLLDNVSQLDQPAIVSMLTLLTSLQWQAYCACYTVLTSCICFHTILVIFCMVFPLVLEFLQKALPDDLTPSVVCFPSSKGSCFQVLLTKLQSIRLCNLAPVGFSHITM